MKKISQLTRAGIIFLFVVSFHNAKAEVKEPTFFEDYVKEGKYNLDEISSSITLIAKLLGRVSEDNEKAELLFKLGKLYTILANETEAGKEELSYRQKAISHFKVGYLFNCMYACISSACTHQFNLFI